MLEATACVCVYVCVLCTLSYGFEWTMYVAYYRADHTDFRDPTHYRYKCLRHFTSCSKAVYNTLKKLPTVL